MGIGEHTKRDVDCVVAVHPFAKLGTSPIS